jgi:hypothetical protein
MIVCGVALLLATPLVSFNAISTRDQVARLEAGKVSPDKFDWAALAFDFGEPGRRALERLKTALQSNRGQRSRVLATAAKAKTRWDLSEMPKAADTRAQDNTYAMPLSNEAFESCRAGLARLPPRIERANVGLERPAATCPFTKWHRGGVAALTTVWSDRGAGGNGRLRCEPERSPSTSPVALTSKPGGYVWRRGPLERSRTTGPSHALDADDVRTALREAAGAKDWRRLRSPTRSSAARSSSAAYPSAIRSNNPAC